MEEIEMPVFGVHKQFKFGAKVGTYSISPAFCVEAKDIESARVLLVEHEKYNQDMIYKVLPFADTVRNDKKQLQSSLKNEWKINDEVWIRLNEYKENEPYVEGVIKEIIEENNNMTYMIWVTGPYASWRAKSKDDIFRYQQYSDNAPKIHNPRE